MAVIKRRIQLITFSSVVLRGRSFVLRKKAAYNADDFCALVQHEVKVLAVDDTCVLDRRGDPVAPCFEIDARAAECAIQVGGTASSASRSKASASAQPSSPSIAPSPELGTAVGSATKADVGGPLTRSTCFGCDQGKSGIAQIPTLSGC